MSREYKVNDAVHWYMSNLSHKIVAQSGYASDRHHLGKLILKGLKDAPDFVLQIDGVTDESETNSSVLKRSVRCALALRKYGLKQGDVIVIMAPNHLDVSIPFYAALYMGFAAAPVDRTFTVKELHDTFDVIKPKIVFCQSEKAPDIQLALNELYLTTEIVTFDKGDYLLCSLSQFLDKYADDASVDEFRAADFNPEDTTAVLIPTSGTTGVPKSAIATHKNFAITMPYLWARKTTFPTPIRLAMIGSPLQWLTALINFILSPIMRYTRLQTSQSLTQEHCVHLLNNYKPTFTVLSPTLMTTLLKESNKCDFSCLELLMLGGSAVPQELIDDVKKLTPRTEVYSVYGMTELTSLGFQTENPAPGSCGKPIGCYQYRIVNAETQKDILEPYLHGELWVKGPGIFKGPAVDCNGLLMMMMVFKIYNSSYIISDIRNLRSKIAQSHSGYYNNSKATQETFAEDGWFKTGDIFYRDQHWNFYFVERIKLLLKYKSHHISPVELESVIRQHPAVLDVAVTGLPDPESGDLAVACVVRRPGRSVTAREIKDLVKKSLTETKQLRGGVIFMNELPMTASTKIHRRKLREMVLEMKESKNNK